MRKLRLTAKDFKEVDGYKEYTGKEDLTDFDGDVEFEANLGWIRVSSIKVSGYLSIKAGSSIRAGSSIDAGDWIEAGDSIEAGSWIRAGSSIDAGDWIEAGDSIRAGSSIDAGDWIEAGDSIEAGDWIKARRGGITCGLQLTCKGLLKFKLRLFAGVSPYAWGEDVDNTVTCGKLEGNVVYGTVVETGMPDKPESINIGGKTYEVTDELKSALKNLKETN